MTAPDVCSVKWCEERDGHLSTHRAYIGEVVARRASVAVTVESAADDGARRTPVVTVGNGETVTVVLTWSQAQQLARTLNDARRRYQ